MERYPSRLDAPKAHALSPRSLEIVRQFNLDVNDIRKIGTKRQEAYWVNFITNLNGEQVGRLPYERMDHEVLDVTPTVSQSGFLSKCCCACSMGNLLSSILYLLPCGIEPIDPVEVSDSVFLR